MSGFNNDGANPQLPFKMMLSPAAAMILLLGPGWKTEMDKEESGAESILNCAPAWAACP